MRSSFDDFVDERLDGLLRYASVLTCDAELAKDVVQEVLLRAQQKWRRIGPMAAPTAYVKRMILNEYLSLRRRRAAHEAAAVAVAREELVDDPSGSYDEREAMLARIAALPPKQRAAVVLRYYEDRTDGEIAELLGCGASTVRSHLARAIAALRTDHVTTSTGDGS
ncbi:SigE family RNA polymerase sigma factor [Labedaea rhizosphaerae]|uniref:RNA polymerase sigma-70 factor (Sigma-E family) n=1 Tax=Labedaea rhizosphaerae TaxID=598644 RepID=A0A4R6S2E5_LABRH|nr:SigE family RNA polymerase sigma factor [Labedaea rhizosphaerae]TDP93789.1 RNA polymerase sigma-70 factor (sigma-E family) [Labedaea rhizosphaerae]